MKCILKKYSLWVLTWSIGHVLTAQNPIPETTSPALENYDKLELELDEKENVALVDAPTNEVLQLKFSTALQKNIHAYRRKSVIAYKYKDLSRAHFLYDSLVNHCLKGTLFDNFKIEEVDGGIFDFATLKKPVFLKTTAGWCEPNVSEIDALNDIADEFEDLMDFVVIYWDPKFRVQKIARKYNKNIKLLFVDESDNKSNHILTTLKHALGIPTIITLTQNRKVVNVMKGVSPKYLEAKPTELASYGTFEGKAADNHYQNAYTSYFNLMNLYVDELASKLKP